jgi:hypothetical protein
MTVEVILSRCIAGTVSTPMEVVRDIFHLFVNLLMGKLLEKELVALTAMKGYFLDPLRPLLEADPLWARVGPFIEGNAPQEE